MSLRAEELAAAIRRRIEQYAPAPEVEEAGVVLQVADGIVRIHGLPGAMAGEVVAFADGERALVLNLEEEEIGAVILGPGTTVREGAVARRTGRVLEVPVGDALLGRVVNALGAPIDGDGPIAATAWRPIDWPAPPIAHRQPVKEPLHTGIKAIDAMIPIGRGQRELLIGDRETGKTAIAIDAILHQRGSGVRCIYVAIGQKTSSVARVVRELGGRGAMDYTIVVSGAASDPPILQYLAPYAGCAMAEEFMYTGGHALVVYDDLARHAIAYRAMSLLLRRPPGREAYPGDVFFQHARLLERAAKLRDEQGGGSLTAIPVVTTLGGDVAAYIPTNVISITDGQIYLETALFFAGFRPAINVGLSVSRVGGAAQVKAMKQVAGRLRLDLAQYRELETFARFATELDEETRRRLERGKRIGEVLKQPQYAPMPVEEQVAIMYAATHGHLDDIPVHDVARFEREFLGFLRTDRSSLLGAIRSRGELDEALLAELTRALAEFKSGWAR